MARTARPVHKRSKRALALAAKKMAAAVQRNGIVSKGEITDQYRSLINTDGVDGREIRSTATEVAKLAAKTHPQVSMEKDGSLQWLIVGKGNRAADVLATA